MCEVSAYPERILVLAPTPRDAAITSRILTEAGFSHCICASLSELCDEMEDGVGALLMTENVLTRVDVSRLSTLLNNQPAWSDLSLLVLSHSGETLSLSQQLTERFGNVTLLDLPVRILSLISAVRTAIRARRRQYQVREHILQRERAEKEAREASKAKDNFLAVLSHELRNPLSPVVTGAELLLRSGRLEARDRTMVEMIKRNAVFQKRLVDDMLDLTRIARNKLVLSMERLDLHEVLHHTVESCQQCLHEKQLSLVLDLEASVRSVEGDEARLHQVFWNLLTNAAKFTPEGGEITIRSRSGETAIQVSVADTGMGIPPELLPKVFTAFEQEESPGVRKLGGLGLGLAITKALVEMHGGEIHVASGGRDHGAQFDLTFPLIPGPQPEESPEEATVTHTAPSRSASILLVEDHPDISVMVAAGLRGLGYTVQTADSQARALELFCREHFDILVSDVGLPDGTGIELMRRISQISPIPGIAVSGFGMEADRRNTAEAGFSEHLVKPVDFGVLEATIARVLAAAAADPADPANLCSHSASRNYDPAASQETAVPEGSSP